MFWDPSREVKEVIGRVRGLGKDRTVDKIQEE